MHACLHVLVENYLVSWGPDQSNTTISNITVTAGLNVDLGSFFELAELIVNMSKGTSGLLKIINKKKFNWGLKS